MLRFQANLGLENLSKTMKKIFTQEISRPQDKTTKNYTIQEVQKPNENITGINKETGQRCFKVVITEEEELSRQDYSNHLQVINYIHERARRH
jgi:hypothetical protein